VELARSPRDRFLFEVGSGPDFAAIFADAYRSSHADKEPAYTLLANVTSAANDLLARGCPPGDLEAAVSSCARTNRGAGLLDVVLAEVQGGERPPRANGRTAGVTRAATLEAWEARHSGSYDP
jgi:hypothetical protein